MKRLLFLLAIAALALPAAALAKGPSEATITGPGLGKAITIVGAEEEGSPLMSFAEQAGFFPAAFGQEPDPMLPGQAQGRSRPEVPDRVQGPGPGQRHVPDQPGPLSVRESFRGDVHEAGAGDLRLHDPRWLVRGAAAQGHSPRRGPAEDRGRRPGSELQLRWVLGDRMARSCHRHRSRGRVSSLVLRPPATAKRSSLSLAT